VFDNILELCLDGCLRRRFQMVGGQLCQQAFNPADRSGFALRMAPDQFRQGARLVVVAHLLE